MSFISETKNKHQTHKGNKQAQYLQCFVILADSNCEL